MIRLCGDAASPEPFHHDRLGLIFIFGGFFSMFFRKNSDSHES